MNKPSPHFIMFTWWHCTLFLKTKLKWICLRLLHSEESWCWFWFQKGIHVCPTLLNESPPCSIAEDRTPGCFWCRMERVLVSDGFIKLPNFGQLLQVPHSSPSWIYTQTLFSRTLSVSMHQSLPTEIFPLEDILPWREACFFRVFEGFGVGW